MLVCVCVCVCVCGVCVFVRTLVCVCVYGVCILVSGMCIRMYVCMYNMMYVHIPL